MSDPRAFDPQVRSALLGLLRKAQRRRLGNRPVLFATHDEAIGAIGPREAEIDEVFTLKGQPCTSGQGICQRAGTWVCAASENDCAAARSALAFSRALT